MLIATLFLECMLGSSLRQSYRANKDDSSPWYLPEAEQGPADGTDWVLMIFTYFLLMTSKIPISFYVTRNIINLVSRYFMVNDLDMYDEVNDEPCQASPPPRRRSLLLNTSPALARAQSSRVPILYRLTQP